MTQPELCAFIQSFLGNKDIYVVLSGGASVSFYSINKYVSYDLDLVSVKPVKRRVIHEAMIEMGFSEVGKYYKHPETQFLVEFLPGPLSIGEEQVSQVDEIRLSTGILRIISPTDCVKDRLAAYYFWGDRQCLEQAILVAMARKVNIDEIRRWSETEGKGEEFESIRTRLVKPIK